jgi:hypothetical protein
MAFFARARPLPHIEPMKRILVIFAAVVLVVAIAALIAPMWTMTSAISLDPFAFKMIVLMVIGCFAVGGGLMFLLFYSARRGHDDMVHHGRGWRDPAKAAEPSED